MQRPEQDHYLVLGITQDANPCDIKKAFRTLALANHPDKNPGICSDGFVKVRSAYDAQSDPTSRKSYDIKYFRIRKEWEIFKKTTQSADEAETQKRAAEHLQRQNEAREKAARDKEEREKEAAREAEMKRAHEEIRKKKEARAEENSRRAAEKARKEQRKAAQSRLAGDNPTQKLDDMCRRFGIPDPSPEDGSIEEVLSRLEAKFGSMRFTSKPKTKGCGHGRWWPRVYGLSACDFCDKEFPMYTLRCPQCDARACVPCKIREAGC